MTVRPLLLLWFMQCSKACGLTVCQRSSFRCPIASSIGQSNITQYPGPNQGKETSHAKPSRNGHDRSQRSALLRCSSGSGNAGRKRRSEIGRCSDGVDGAGSSPSLEASALSSPLASPPLSLRPALVSAALLWLLWRLLSVPVLSPPGNRPLLPVLGILEYRRIDGREHCLRPFLLASIAHHIVSGLAPVFRERIR
jgi:hypothetical protein